MKKWKVKVTSLAYHRNGVTGDPSWVALLDDNHNGQMVATYFPRQRGCLCNVLNVQLLAEGKIEFGENSWRGDDYLDIIKAAVKENLDKELEVTSHD